MIHLWIHLYSFPIQRKSKMQEDPPATFHCFSRLPLELRIQIWEAACTSKRVVQVHRRACQKFLKPWPADFNWDDFTRPRVWPKIKQCIRSPTAAPSVTRACQESRKYCSYKKSFILDGCTRYIWANFEADVFYMHSSVIVWILDDHGATAAAIKHLRLHNITVCGDEDADGFGYTYRYRVAEFTNLANFELLVDRLWQWGNELCEPGWGPPSPSNLRCIDRKTGEYITAENGEAYVDWYESGGGTLGYLPSEWDQTWHRHQDEESRIEAMMEMKNGLPRMEVDW
jgi:hypothetical protein